LCHSPGMTVFYDLEAEQVRLERLLADLDWGQWTSASGAQGWTIADVVLHLAQSEEAVTACIEHPDLRAAAGGRPASTVEEHAAEMVRAERPEVFSPSPVFGRWRHARRRALDALRGADPQLSIEWVAGPVKPATLATTRLTEHWAHGLDITGPLGLNFPDTERLRHVAWLAHRTLPYALALSGEQQVAVRCELTAPDGSQVWRYGPSDAGSSITGPAGEFCRVAVHRLDPAGSALKADGPHGSTALRVLRTYAQ
jgi:uncharacterized protein (TIGR03084 family)